MDKGDMIPLKKNNIVNKLLNYFKNIFLGKDNQVNINEKDNLKTNVNEEGRESFKEGIVVKKRINANLSILEKYRSGDIDEETMSDEEFDCLCNIYRDQISKLKKSNEFRKNKLLRYKEKKANI